MLCSSLLVLAGGSKRTNQKHKAEGVIKSIDKLVT